MTTEQQQAATAPCTKPHTSPTTGYARVEAILVRFALGSCYTKPFHVSDTLFSYH